MEAPNSKLEKFENDLHAFFYKNIEDLDSNTFPVAGFCLLMLMIQFAKEKNVSHKWLRSVVIKMIDNAYP